jgi:catechol 2,3-dioxygenase-like lactoylglutathione lyase family enzyme
MIESHATVLVVDDVAAALDYYRDKLGFEGHAYERDPTNYGYATREGCQLHFAHTPGQPPQPNGFFDVYVYVDDVDALHEELAGRGAEILNAPVNTEYGLREIRVRDPNGYVLAFGKLPE